MLREETQRADNAAENHTRFLFPGELVNAEEHRGAVQPTPMIIHHVAFTVGMHSNAHDARY